MPSPTLDALARLAAFQNPDFYRKQSLRLSTALTARVIGFAGDFPAHIALPRGCKDHAAALLESLGVKLEHVVVDECHHGPARQFDRVVSEVKARYVTGLTATPKRRDGQHPILEMQLGPARYVVDPRSKSGARTYRHRIFVRKTDFELPDASPSQSIHGLYRSLAGAERRDCAPSRHT